MTLPLRKILYVLLAVFLLSGCASPTPTASLATPTVDAETIEANPSPEVTPSPTVAMGQLLWVHAAGSSPDITTALKDIALQEGLELVEQESLPAELVAETKLVVVENPPAEQLAALAGTSAQAQFLAVGSYPAPPAGNISVLKAERSHAAFVAGLITQMVSPDFRGGALFADGSAELLDAFANGGRYLCGRCTPIYAPVVLFPVTQAVSDPARPENWSAAFAALQQNRLETFYMPAEAASQDWPDFLNALQAAQVNMLGELKPASIPAEWWVATVRLDAASALQTIIPALLSGQGGQLVHAAVVLEDVNPEMLSPGKIASAKIAIDDLAAGYLHPLSVPLE